ncbi:hypothetical protein N7G274_003299 [Stereocaulon virgatum]|uniref:Uncharacterized protein n=1 Tax=Stereocaulon virgatum TaxID=373712 RepID=A0ABR4AE84_9LECA
MDQQTSKTHDTTMAPYHIEDLATFGEWLNNATAAAFPRVPSSSRYREVYALLLSWEEDNLGIIGEIRQLDDVLKDVYHYETGQWKIPNTRSHNSLASRLTTFLNEHESKDNLLIVYHGGHGHMNDIRQCVWSS